jgi:hypothetical protein
VHTERYRERSHGVLSRYDQIVITGPLPGMCYAAATTSFLYAKGIHVFDYARFAEPLREGIRAREQQLADEQGVRIEFIGRGVGGTRRASRAGASDRGDGSLPGCGPWHSRSRNDNFFANPDKTSFVTD